MIRHALKRIEAWPERAHAAGYCVKALAKQCGVSVRALERFFAERMGKSPRNWLHDERMKRARELLVDGSTVKGTAECLGYRSQQNLSRNFKTHFGHTPTRSLSETVRGPACRL